MYIEQWKDTAFGSDFGDDFLQVMESMENDCLSLDALFARSNLQTFLEKRKAFMFAESMDDMTIMDNDGRAQPIHYEEVIIALAATAIECQLNGQADLTQCYGTKVITSAFNEQELALIGDALNDIYHHPDAFTLFQLLDGEERQETLQDIADILSHF